jgi:hypothetical protein
VPFILAAAISVVGAGQQLPPRDTPHPSAPLTATVQGRVVADDSGVPIRDCDAGLPTKCFHVTPSHSNSATANAALSTCR